MEAVIRGRLVVLVALFLFPGFQRHQQSKDNQ